MIVFFRVWLLLLVCSSLHATEVYQWLDEDGRQVFADQPPDATAQPVQLTPSSNRYLFNVKRVSDGDTLVLENNERVRLLSVNAPEISSRYREAESGGIAAKNWLQAQLKQGQIYLQYDTERRDRYNRLLAYAWSTDGTFLNEQLLKQGLATLALQPPNLHYADELIAAQQQAIQQQAGIWGDKAYQPRKVSSLDETAYRGWHRWRLAAKSRSQTRDYWVLKVDNKVSVRIAKKQQNLFPVMEEYLNKPLEVRGWMSKRGDQYRLFVQHPSAIVVLD